MKVDSRQIRLSTTYSVVHPLITSIAAAPYSKQTTQLLELTDFLTRCRPRGSTPEHLKLISSDSGYSFKAKSECYNGYTCK